MSIADEIIERFMAIFGEPKTPNPEVFLAEYADCMEGYDEAALRRAADRLIRSKTFWPRPAELLEEANRVLAERRIGKPVTPEPPRRDPTAEERANVLEELEGFRKFMAANVTVSVTADEARVKGDFIRVQRPGFYERQRNAATEQSK
jgi:hypothetical protein